MRGWLRKVLPVLLLIAIPPSYAAQAWLEVGDARLRGDLQLLADAGLISLPLAAWPIPVSDVERVLNEMNSSRLPSNAYDAVIARVQASVRANFDRGIHFDTLRASAGQASVLRDFDTAGREDGELTVGIAKLGRGWAAELRGTIAIAPSDDKKVRLDGSHVTARWGNWFLSANVMDRWWGPGNVSSLILSNNARPIPSLVLDRATSTAFRWRPLRWLGPWRATALLGRMESGRADVQNPLFLGMRASFRPVRMIEIGLSRTAQFCGEGRTCDLQTFADVLGFNDTAGVTVSPERQPGNQLAGWDVRIASPWPVLPLAVYKQDIGEDRIDFKPTDRLYLYGAESWHLFANGASLRGYVEYSDATCAAEGGNPVFNCAYSNNIFFADGYRYRGRAIGHTTDADAQLRAAGVRWASSTGTELSLDFRNAALNRDPGPDPNNGVSIGPADYESAAIGWRRRIRGGALQLQLGIEKIAPLDAADRQRAFGFVSWRTPY
jgi:hypothetical protein